MIQNTRQSHSQTVDSGLGMKLMIQLICQYIVILSCVAFDKAIYMLLRTERQSQQLLGQYVGVYQKAQVTYRPWQGGSRWAACVQCCE